MANIDVVIKIDEEEYKNIKACTSFMPWTEHLIKNGTPLPKGHGRLIEVTNQLEQELFTFTRYTGIDECPYESATLITDNAPTIIEADKESK